MLTAVFIISAITVTYYLVKLNYQYWEKRGVTGPKPSFFVGNIGRTFILKAQPGDIYNENYAKYKNLSFVGLYRALTPVLLLRDPELIKEVTIKSFHHFQDNDMNVKEDVDVIFGKNPFILKGDRWKTVRSQLTPAFTSGKMKWIYPYIEENSRRMIKFIEDRPNATNGDGLDVKDLSIRFTLNNVGDSVFGIEGKCFEEENSEFRQLARDFLSPESWSILVFYFATIFPKLTELFPIRMVPKKVQDKLMRIVSDTLKYREENNVERNDFLHILSQLKKNCKDNEFTDADVTAHAGGFFADGSETSSMVMSAALFQLSSNPEVQSKLREEINKHFDENGGNLPYEVVQSLAYLDAVVNETLRTLPPIYSLQKVCTRDFAYAPKETNRPLLIERGTPIILPLWGLHHDPEHFEDPEQFRPERFLGGNKETIKKCTFLPFGEGPRTCLGRKFGLLQVKIGISYIIKNFEMSLNKKTQVPLKFDPTNILLTPIGGLWVDFKKVGTTKTMF